MSIRPGAVRRTAAVAATAAAAVALTVTGAAAPSAVASAAHGVTPAIGAHPHLVKAGSPSPTGQVKFGCQTVRPGRLTCFGPDQIRAAYSIQPLLDKGFTGKGRTIVIVDAYSPPAVLQDLQTFDSTWGIPDPELRIVAPQGATPWDGNDANQVGWAGEINLDVQYSHAVAPDAKIVLVEARTNDDADILAATKWAVDNRIGDVISQSFGEDERCVDPAILKAEHEVFEKATDRGITLIASAGDQGSSQPTCVGSDYSLAASSPASDPLVTGIGGTSLAADLVTGAYQSETVWNETDAFGAAGGGGFSVLERKPEYQRGVVPGRYRGVPDVSYNGGINNGVLVYYGPDASGGAPSFYITGGTSSGSPQWAGLTAIGAQIAHHKLGLLNPTLYALGRSRFASRVFHDITVGDNGYAYVDVNNNVVTIPGYSATPGWDAATGWGTPIASTLVPILAAAAGH
jgi:subtilase family serine protease